MTAAQQPACLRCGEGGATVPLSVRATVGGEPAPGDGAWHLCRPCADTMTAWGGPWLDELVVQAFARGAVF